MFNNKWGFDVYIENHRQLLSKRLTPNVLKGTDCHFIYSNIKPTPTIDDSCDMFKLEIYLLFCLSHVTKLYFKTKSINKQYYNYSIIVLFDIIHVMKHKDTSWLCNKINKYIHKIDLYIQ